MTNCLKDRKLQDLEAKLLKTDQDLDIKLANTSKELDKEQRSRSPFDGGDLRSLWKYLRVRKSHDELTCSLQALSPRRIHLRHATTTCNQDSVRYKRREMPCAPNRSRSPFDGGDLRSLWKYLRVRKSHDELTCSLRRGWRPNC
jgi:hypothetical protein